MPDNLPQICSETDNPSGVEEWEVQLIYDCEKSKKITRYFVFCVQVLQNIHEHVKIPHTSARCRRLIVSPQQSRICLRRKVML